MRLIGPLVSPVGAGGSGPAGRGRRVGDVEVEAAVGSSRVDEERRPARTRQQPSQGGQQHPIGRALSRPGDLTAQHRQLMTKDSDLGHLAAAAAPGRDPLKSGEAD
ncbi:hypothetical protein BL253_07995 [Pseudofrankia asymbiotica]|uniref:Uncharacterized protein n=1 Tax=Pseudofrankia asymbiotica TaxID=1834516 RepID=A0A1V2IEX4_9ACTN|nr:hypothetical protein BL253_07995 [Pseudofrankia asymbiotica]